MQFSNTFKLLREAAKVNEERAKRDEAQSEGRNRSQSIYLSPSATSEQLRQASKLSLNEQQRSNGRASIDSSTLYPQTSTTSQLYFEDQEQQPRQQDPQAIVRRKLYKGSNGDQGFQDLATTRLKSSNKVLPFTEQRPVETMEKIAENWAKNINYKGLSITDRIEESQNQDEVSQWPQNETPAVSGTSTPLMSISGAETGTPRLLKVKKYKLKAPKSARKAMTLAERTISDKAVRKAKDLKKYMQQKTSLFQLRQQQKETQKKAKGKKADKKYKVPDKLDLSEMGEEERRQKLVELWSVAGERAFLMGAIIMVFKHVNQQVQQFGTSRRVKLKERKVTKSSAALNSRCKTIHPENPWKRCWDLFVGIILIYTALVVPVRLAFEDSTPVGWLSADFIIDGIFLTDMILTFLTGFRDKSMGGGLVTSKKSIAKRYLKGWFIVDLFSTFPFQIIELIYASQRNSSSLNKLLRLLRLPRIYRLIRLFKCVRLMKMPAFKKCCKYLRINDGVKRLLLAAGLALFFSHLVTCMWLLFAKLDDFSDQTWLARTGALSRSAAYQYFLGFYWTAQTVTTVGFGDIPAKTSLEMGLALVWMMLGVGFYSYVVGNFSSMLASVDLRNRELKNQLIALNKFVEQEKIPDQLERRITAHLEENIRRNTFIKTKNSLLEELPPALKIEVMNHTHGDLIHGLRFFEGRPWHFIWFVIQRLTPINFAKKELLYREGDIANACFFLLDGAVQLLTEAGLPFRKFFSRAHFGQYSLLRQVPRPETAMAQIPSKILVLPKSDFLALLDQFPREERDIRAEADTKQEVLEKARATVEQCAKDVSLMKPMFQSNSAVLLNNRFKPLLSNAVSTSSSGALPTAPIMGEQDKITRTPRRAESSPLPPDIQAPAVSLIPPSQNLKSSLQDAAKLVDSEEQDKPLSSEPSLSLFRSDGSLQSKEITQRYLSQIAASKATSLFKPNRPVSREAAEFLQIAEQVQNSLTPRQASLESNSPGFRRTFHGQQFLSKKMIAETQSADTITSFNSNLQFLASSSYEVFHSLQLLSAEQSALQENLAQNTAELKEMRNQQNRIEDKLERLLSAVST